MKKGLTRCVLAQYTYDGQTDRGNLPAFVMPIYKLILGSSCLLIFDG